ncbi:MAG: twin-arginine translocation signal domain-containing protein, partial [Actinomycetota bacterium]
MTVDKPVIRDSALGSRFNRRQFIAGAAGMAGVAGLGSLLT